LSSGERDKGLTSGDRDKGLSSGDRDKGLTSGDRDKGLSGGERDKGLSSGDRDKHVLALHKAGSGRATAERAARFVLPVTNGSEVVVDRVGVVDRVTRDLRVEASEAATTPLPDGSTLLLFRSTAPLPPGGARTFSFRVYAR